MLELLIVDVDDVFLVDEDVPEMPESADSFRVKYLPVCGPTIPLGLGS